MADEKTERKQLKEGKDKAILDDWYERTNGMTLETLPGFLKELTEVYEHDYGTIVHAIAAAALAAANAVEKSPQGGITGFQASFIPWKFFRKWNRIESPLRLLDFDKMLYPQYEERFLKTISPSTWKWLQKEAKKRIATSKGAKRVVKHWKKIAKGKVPFGYKVVDDDAPPTRWEKLVECVKYFFHKLFTSQKSREKAFVDKCDSCTGCGEEKKEDEKK